MRKKIICICFCMLVLVTGFIPSCTALGLDPNDWDTDDDMIEDSSELMLVGGSTTQPTTQPTSTGSIAVELPEL